MVAASAVHFVTLALNMKYKQVSNSAHAPMRKTKHTFAL